MKLKKPDSALKLDIIAPIGQQLLQPSRLQRNFLGILVITCLIISAISSVFSGIVLALYYASDPTKRNRKE